MNHQFFDNRGVLMMTCEDSKGQYKLPAYDVREVTDRFEPRLPHVRVFQGMMGGKHDEAYRVTWIDNLGELMVYHSTIHAERQLLNTWGMRFMEEGDE